MLSETADKTAMTSGANQTMANGGKPELLTVADLAAPSPKPGFRDRLLSRRHGALVFDPKKCNGCGKCEAVCSERNGDNLSPAGAAIRIIRDEGRGKYFAVYCGHCRDPLCMDVCPERAISKGIDGIVRIDAKRCVHCGLCTLSCPQAAPLRDPTHGTIRKCDLCEGAPRCVEQCAEGALAVTRGKRLGWIKLIRWPVQLLSFLLLVVVLVGTFCALDVAGFHFSCPLGVVQNMAASGAIVLSVVASGLFILALTVLAGRAFCGWLCPFGFILDLAGKIIPQKLRFPSFLRTRTAKYGILAASVGGSAAMATPAFCTVCPIGTVCRSYGVQGFFKGYEMAVIPALMALEAGQKRGWCRYFCPVGALLALTARIGLIRIVIGAPKCKKFSCMRCADACPAGIIDRDQLREGISPALPMHECILCLRCLDQCPYGAVKIRFRWQGKFREAPRLGAS